MRNPDRKSVRPPMQQRSRDSLEGFLRAAERLLENALWDELTIGQIVAEAGSSVGAFYARFASKDAMLPVLLERYVDTLATSAMELYGAVPPKAGLEERARAIVIERVSRYRRWRGLLRALVILGRTRPDAVGDTTGLHAATVGQAILDFMEPAFGEIRRGDPATAVRRGFYFVSAICRERVLFDNLPHLATTPLTDDELIEELTAMLVGYLRAEVAHGWKQKGHRKTAAVKKSHVRKRKRS
jgi:AcrR family transcriptional regulator